MYIKFADYKGGKVAKGDIILMSAWEFANGGNLLKGIPVAITPDGSEPVEYDEMAEPPIDITPPEPDLKAEVEMLKERLAKVENVDVVKTELSKLEPVAKEPILKY